MRCKQGRERTKGMVAMHGLGWAATGSISYRHTITQGVTFGRLTSSSHRIRCPKNIVRTLMKDGDTEKTSFLITPSDEAVAVLSPIQIKLRPYNTQLRNLSSLSGPIVHPFFISPPCLVFDLPFVDVVEQGIEGEITAEGVFFRGTQRRFRDATI